MELGIATTADNVDPMILKSPTFQKEISTRISALQSWDFKGETPHDFVVLAHWRIVWLLPMPITKQESRGRGAGVAQAEVLVQVRSSRVRLHGFFFFVGKIQSEPEGGRHGLHCCGCLTLRRRWHVFFCL